MLLSFSILMFVSIGLVTVLLTLRWGRSPSHAIARIASPSQAETHFLPSPSLAWREVVNRIGHFVPASSKQLSLWKRRLIRAGYRNPNAPRFLVGARIVSAAVFGVAAVVIGLRAASLDNLALKIGGAVLAGYMAPAMYLNSAIRRRQRAVNRGIPDTLDLLVVCVESGLGLDQAIIQVAKELHAAHPEICEELGVVNLEMRAGKSRSDALHNLAQRTGVEDLRKLVAVLIQTDRFGTSVAQSLRGHAEYMRTMARQRAEEKAAKLPVKMIFPIFFCVLPSLFVVTLGPVVTRVVRELKPLIENL